MKVTIFCAGLLPADPIDVVEDSRLLLRDVLLLKLTALKMRLQIVLMGGEYRAP